MTMEKNVLRKLLLAGYAAGVKGIPQEELLELMEASL
jgi:hypothetical protein